MKDSPSCISKETQNTQINHKIKRKLNVAENYICNEIKMKIVFKNYRHYLCKNRECYSLLLWNLYLEHRSRALWSVLY